MKDIARPTDEELNRMEELAREYFVIDSWAIDSKLWDDGDVHLTAYSTLATNVDDGYKTKHLHHRQTIHYQREGEYCHYKNVVTLQSPEPDRVLNMIEIEW